MQDEYKEGAGYNFWKISVKYCMLTGRCIFVAGTDFMKKQKNNVPC